MFFFQRTVFKFLRGQFNLRWFWSKRPRWRALIMICTQDKKTTNNTYSLAPPSGISLRRICSSSICNIQQIAFTCLTTPSPYLNLVRAVFDDRRACAAFRLAGHGSPLYHLPNGKRRRVTNRWPPGTRQIPRWNPGHDGWWKVDNKSGLCLN